MKKIVIDIPIKLPSIPFKDLKEKYEVNGLKEKKNRDVGGLKESILMVGFCFPIYLWLEGKYVTDGAGRIMALDMLEYEGYEVPDIPYIPISAKNKKEAKRKTLLVSSRYGEISKESGTEFLLEMEEIDLSPVSLPELTMEDLDWKPGKAEYEVQEDEAPEPPVAPTSKRGDMYQLGRHRLMCGDALGLTDVGKLMGGGSEG